MKTLKRTIFAILGLVLSTAAFATVKLPVIFQNNMVLQRDKEVIVWGFADKGEQVELVFKAQTFKTRTAKNGKWTISLPQQPAGGPYNIEIKGSGNRLVLSNVLFGDVWLCGGQSNMQYTVSQIGYTHADTAAANDDGLRLFTASINLDYVPKDDLAGGTWMEASPETIKHFSAAAYFFGKTLRDSLAVPIGLISNNLGATSVETWMSGEALSEFPQFRNYHKTYLAPAKSFREITEAFESGKSAWEKNYYHKGTGFEQKWYLPETDISGWQTMEIPGWWEDKGLADFDGAVWFRKSFDIPADFKGETFPLRLNQVDDYDIVWVNGEKVGEGYGNQNWRNYSIPSKLLKEKDNVLVVRVFDAGGKGGMYSHQMWGNPLLLGQWKYKADDKIDANAFPKPHVVNANMFSSPSVLFNGNIAPITQLSLKGAIWYQGESNASRAGEYKALFPAFITDWRKQFKQPGLPFLFVQLANYMQEATTPRESEWAELREAQSAALHLPKTGMAVAIDIGEANDIHPKNKMEAGKRLALSALNIAYDRNIRHTGPVYQSMQVAGDSIIIHYSSNSGKLMTKDKYGYVSGFAIAGSDNKFHWAKACIRNNSIVVYSPLVKAPVAVRYAWSDNPGTLNLYNEAGLPAVPFRTDELPTSTLGKAFKDEPWE